VRGILNRTRQQGFLGKDNGYMATDEREQEFFDLSERFRSATNPEDVKRLGDQLGRMIFGG